MLVHGDAKRGESRKSIYNVWKGMRNRCHNKNSTGYKWYGARGISVCIDWFVYTKFREWAYKNGYHEGLEIDRIDNNGNYEPENCRWVTRKENCLNMGKNKRYPCFGENLTISQMAEKYNIINATISWRINKMGMTPDAAVSIPNSIKNKSKKLKNRLN